MTLRSLIVLLALLLLTLPAQAQTPPAQAELPPPTRAETLSLRFDRLNVEDGLAQGTIYAIHQDRRGYLWFGTQDGMSRYDGYAFKNYGAVAFDTTALLPGWITGIAEDRDGVLWVVSRLQGLNRFNPVTETATHYRHDPDDLTSLGDGRPTWPIHRRSRTRPCRVDGSRQSLRIRQATSGWGATTVSTAMIPPQVASPITGMIPPTRPRSPTHPSIVWSKARMERCG